MVVVGLATGLLQVVQDKPVDADQLYAVAPVAVNVVDEPEQILTAEPALTVGRGLTVTATLAVLEQPVVVLVPVTV